MSDSPDRVSAGTPYLSIDTAKMERNILKMAEVARKNGVALMTDAKIRRALRLGQRVRLVVGVDSMEGARRLSTVSKAEEQVLGPWKGMATSRATLPSCWKDSRRSTGCLL